MGGRFWREDKTAPFATLLSVVDTYCHPEASDWGYEELQRIARENTFEVMPTFKAELREALADPSRLPKGALGLAAEYDDGSDEAFLRRLWRDLYGDEGF
ncbi:MAG: hypothetical protein ACJ73S_18500 [Mycobacteriales bacterium]